MLFNSIDFAIFLPIVFILYWFLYNKKLKEQNLFLLIVSYVFYGWWDWRFLFLIALSSLVDYFVGIYLAKKTAIKTRRRLLAVSLIMNLGMLGFFKYFNFFVDNFVSAFTLFGKHLDPLHLKVILPVGISFYTFQTLSYSIDIYKKKIKPTKDFIAFFAFVSFFPQLVAGPIERAKNLLPQFFKERKFEYDKAVDGLRQILWGLFKKIVIADNAAVYVDQIFGNYQNFSGSTLLLGVILFAFQIYGDFSGYSDIAIGTARLFGFNLMQNFNFPYFSRNIAEFWRRWHISLSTWFRDYVYIPLGGSRVSPLKKIRNVFVIFIVSGFWHGANWTFIIWGGLNALYFLPSMLLRKNRMYTNTVAEGKVFPTVREFFEMSITFFLTLIAWVFFRSESVTSAIEYIKGIFSNSIISIPQTGDRYILALIIVFVIIEWLNREKQYALENIGNRWPRFFRWSFYYILILIILWFGHFSEPAEFIYFQF